MGVSLGEYHKLLDEIKGISLVPENINETLLEGGESGTLATDSEELFQSAYRREIQQQLAESIKSLSAKEQLVLSLYYYEELTMKEVGVALGYTESRISQIHTKAIIKLRSKLAKKLSAEDLPPYIGSKDLLWQVPQGKGVSPRKNPGNESFVRKHHPGNIAGSTVVNWNYPMFSKCLDSCLCRNDQSWLHMTPAFPLSNRSAIRRVPSILQMGNAGPRFT